MADRRRVAITGIGALTPIGITRDALWQGLLARRSAVRPVSRFDASIYRSQIAAEIDFHPSDFIEERKVKRLDRFGQFTVACSRLAVTGVRPGGAAGSCACTSTRRRGRTA